MSDSLNYKALANKLMFDLSDDEVKFVEAEFEMLLKQIDLLDHIDTEGVEEMVYPLFPVTTFLREDEVSDVLSQDAVLQNAKKVKEGHVHVPKVVRS